MMYRWIKEYYDAGIYKDSDLEIFVAGGMITKKQAEEIKAGQGVIQVSRMGVR